MSVRRTSRDFRHLRAREDPGSFRTLCDGVYADGELASDDAA